MAIKKFQYHQSDIRTIYGEFTEIVDDLDDPPIDLSATFDTVEGWLIDMSQFGIPDQFVSRYDINVFEAENQYALALSGVKVTSKENSTRIEIVFEPRYAYYPLPATYFRNLTRNEVMNKIVRELISFTKTHGFQTSFFVRAQSIWFAPTGDNIWSK